MPNLGKPQIEGRKDLGIEYLGILIMRKPILGYLGCSIFVCL